MTNDESLAKLKAERIADRAALRRKLLGVMNRYALERMSGFKQPHLANVETLKEAAVNNWDAAQAAKIFAEILHKAS